LTFSYDSNDITENVFILQAWGFWGAFGGGVFKAVVDNNVKLDTITGASTVSLWVEAERGLFAWDGSLLSNTIIILKSVLL
jgi:hypothetical protein